jgi:hypothetical protein
MQTPAQQLASTPTIASDFELAGPACKGERHREWHAIGALKKGVSTTGVSKLGFTSSSSAIAIQVKGNGASLLEIFTNSACAVSAGSGAGVASSAWQKQGAFDANDGWRRTLGNMDI